jgi:hypothetical protein
MPLTPVNGAVEVTGALGATTWGVSVSNDIDFYTFEATKDDVVQIDIDGAMRMACMDPEPRCLDTVIAVFDANGNKLRDSDENPGDVDVGSDSTNDSFIIDWLVPQTGRYYVGVAGTGMMVQRMWLNGGTLDSETADPNTGNGSYRLLISGVNTPTGPVGGDPGGEQPGGEEPGGEQPGGEMPGGGNGKVVNIDIRPRDPGVARVYPNAEGRINVAILSTSNFNAMKVDKHSLKFGAEGTELSYVGCYHHGIDVNRDRKKDLVCRFDVKKAGFDVGDLEGVLTGTVEGVKFEGRAPLKVVMKGKKRKYHHHHHGWDRGYNWHSRGRDRD